MAARAIWKGIVKVGSVALPVKLYAAVEDRDVHFHVLQSRTKSRELRDECSRALLKLAEKKHAQRKDVVGTHSKKSRPEKVVDLMEVLKPCAPRERTRRRRARSLAGG